MIVTCESCEAQFRVDPEALGVDGRRVRCSDCGHEWFQEPEDPEEPEELEEEEPATEEEAKAPEDKDVEEIMEEIGEAISLENDSLEEDSDNQTEIEEARPQPKLNSRSEASKSRQQQFAKIAAVLVFCGLLSVLWFYKSAIGAMWPATHAVYSLLGQSSDVLGINDISFERFDVVQNGVELDVRGMVYNLKSEPVKLPPLILRAKGENNTIVKEFFWEVDQPFIEAEGTLEIDRLLDLGNNTKIKSIELRPVTHIEHQKYLETYQSSVSSEG